MLKDAVKLRNNTFKENIAELKSKREKRKTLMHKIKSKQDIDHEDELNISCEIRNSTEISKINTEIVAGENISSDNLSSNDSSDLEKDKIQDKEKINTEHFTVVDKNNNETSEKKEL